MQITTYATWARENGKKCRTFSHYDQNVPVYRVTDRPTILHRAGFRLLGGTDRSKDFRTPRDAVNHMISDWAAPLYEVLYYESIQGEVIVWAK